MATDSIDIRTSDEVSGFLTDQLPAFTRRLAEIEDQVKDHETPFSREHVARVSDAINETRDACRELESRIADDPDLLHATQRACCEAIAPWFSQSWFMERATSKPKGYPGDFLLLSGMYDEIPKSSGIGGYLDVHLLEIALAQAVRARMEVAKQFLVDELARRKGDVSIMNVACGPCREFTSSLPHPPDVRPTITCVDSDEETLEFVEKQVAPRAGDGVRLKCARYNALRMSSSKRNIKTFGRQDVIYSIGLFDYIPDRLLIPILRGLRETLAEGGVLYVAFKDAERYDKTVYQWMTDWFFYARTVDDFHELYRQAGFDVDSLEMIRDDTGIIVNFISRVPTDDRYRLDGAQAKPERPLAADAPAALPRADSLTDDAS